VSDSPKTPHYRWLGLFAAGIALVVVFFLGGDKRSRDEDLTPERAEELGVAPLPSGSYETTSEYSRIRVEASGTVRTLFFVADDGSMAVESRMDVARPHELLVPYTQAMFASYLFMPRHERVLIVGLGGGSMVRFLEHHDPELEVDAVEIDPAVIEVARDCFGTRASEKIRIIEQDAFDFLESSARLYDVIYMDAFLKPSENTDATGIPLRLKTEAFLRDLQTQVHPEGLIVFNVNDLEDLDLLRDVFAETYVFRLGAPGAVAIGTSVGRRATREQLEQAARSLDERFEANFSFVEMVGRLSAL